MMTHHSGLSSWPAFALFGVGAVLFAIAVALKVAEDRRTYFANVTHEEGAS